MKQRTIIKNVKKYNKIKLCKGIDLDQVQTTKRYGSNGISTFKWGNSWFMLPKGRAIFKTFDDHDLFFKNIKNLRLANELICYEIAKQVNVPCAEYQLAKKNSQKGIVSYDVSKPGETICSLYEFYKIVGLQDRRYSFYIFAKALDRLNLMEYKLDKANMLKGFYKIAIFDILTAQADRHVNNIIVLLNKQSKTVRLSPVIDNEMAFNITSLEEIFMKGTKVTKNKFLQQLQEIPTVLFMKDITTDYSLNFYDINLKEIIKVAKTNPEYAQIFKDMVKNMDINKAIENVKKQGVMINKFYEEYLVLAQKAIKQNIKNKLSLDINDDQSYNFINSDNLPTL